MTEDRPSWFDRRALEDHDVYVAYIRSGRWHWIRRATLAIHGRRCFKCGTTKGGYHVLHMNYRTVGRENPEHDLRIIYRPCNWAEHGIDPKAKKPKRGRWGG